MILVIDASAAHNASLAEHGFAFYRREELVAPPLLWSEVRSGLHEAVWRGDLAREHALVALDVLAKAPIRVATDRRLALEAWRVADELGWAKTYDAEYVALARLLSCRLVTVDDRMRRATVRFGYVIGPEEL